MLKNSQGRLFLFPIPSGAEVKAGFSPQCLSACEGQLVFHRTSLSASSFKDPNLYMAFLHLYVLGGLFAGMFGDFRLQTST